MTPPHSQRSAMTCGCGKNKRKSQVQKSVSYAPNGNGNGTVRLGLKATMPLPLRMPQAINGQDVIILANKRQTVPVLEVAAGSKPALVVYGRNAYVETGHKDALVGKWPKAFHAA